MSDPKWIYRFLNLAEHIGQWSKDTGAKVGCVLVNDQNRVISTGYNGPPHGVTDRSDLTREQKLSVTLHAEENAILFATAPLLGARAFCNYPPCSLCAARLIQVGVKEIHCYTADEAIMKRWKESLDLGERLCEEAGVTVTRHAWDHVALSHLLSSGTLVY